MKNRKKRIVVVLGSISVIALAIYCFGLYFPHESSSETFGPCPINHPNDGYDWLIKMSELWEQSDRQDLVRLVKEGIEKNKSPDDIWCELKATPNGTEATITVE